MLLSLIKNADHEIDLDKGQGLAYIAIDGDEDNFLEVMFKFYHRVSHTEGEIWSGAIAIPPSAEICDVEITSVDKTVDEQDSLIEILTDLVYAQEVEPECRYLSFLVAY